MKHFKIDLKNKEPEIIEVPDHITTEGWLAAVRRSDGKFAVLNSTSYLKEEIVNVTEEKSRHGFTKMEGV
jgi:hypothetical protein